MHAPPSWETVVSKNRQCFARPRWRTSSLFSALLVSIHMVFAHFPVFSMLRVSQEVRPFHRVQENTPINMNDTHKHTSTDSHMCHLLELSSGCHLSLPLKTLRLFTLFTCSRSFSDFRSASNWSASNWRVDEEFKEKVHNVRFVIII